MAYGMLKCGEFKQALRWIPRVGCATHTHLTFCSHLRVKTQQKPGGWKDMPPSLCQARPSEQRDPASSCPLNLTCLNGGWSAAPIGRIDKHPSALKNMATASGSHSPTDQRVQLWRLSTRRASSRVPVMQEVVGCLVHHKQSIDCQHPRNLQDHTGQLFCSFRFSSFQGQARPQ